MEWASIHTDYLFIYSPRRAFTLFSDTKETQTHSGISNYFKTQPKQLNRVHMCCRASTQLSTKMIVIDAIKKERKKPSPSETQSASEWFCTIGLATSAGLTCLWGIWVLKKSTCGQVKRAEVTKTKEIAFSIVESSMFPSSLLIFTNHTLSKTQIPKRAHCTHNKMDKRMILYINIKPF